jgi:hypothetical protein
MSNGATAQVLLVAGSLSNNVLSASQDKSWRDREGAAEAQYIQDKVALLYLSVVQGN